MNNPTIETQVVDQNQALTVRQEGGAIGRPMTLEELHANLEFVRQVMKKEMREDQDYGKIPGCGPKPSLFQPGAQKLLMVFNLCERVREEQVKDYPGGHREYAFTIVVRAPNGKEWDGVGTCSTLEAKYRYRMQELQCPACGKSTVKKSKHGDGFYCWSKIGGCGANFAADAKAITSQSQGRVEHDNPADFWNTVRKMAFKRALVSASINATNTSELWTQDVEDMPRTGTVPEEEGPPEQEPPQRPKPTPAPRPAAAPKAPTPKSDAKTPPVARFPTPEYREQMIANLQARPGEPGRDLVTEYFKKVTDPAQLMPFETLEELKLCFVPATKDQMLALNDKIRAFANGERAEPAFPAHLEPAPAREPTKGKAEPVQQEMPADPAAPAAAPAEGNCLQGKIAHVTLKHGSSKRGPWTLYGLKVGGEWANTFSDTIGQAASDASGADEEVTVYYEETDKGKTITALKLSDGTVIESET